jgi:A/G-specific adenine glycosylase
MNRIKNQKVTRRKNNFRNSASKKSRLVPILLDWFSKNARDLPWRRTRDPYAIWVSEIMLQQTQVKTVVPYWERWMRELPGIKPAADASPDKIHKLWEGLGYYTRARNLQKAAQQIMAGHGGRFPQNFDDVLALPGIGRYTAGAICSIAFNQPAPILDGNVIRVLTRIFGIGENPREKTTNARLWGLAEELVIHASRITHHAPRFGSRTRDENEDDLAISHFNQSLMELGALVCTPRQPKCPDCPVKNLCVAFGKNRVEQLPNLGKRKAATARRFAAFVVERNGRFLVRQRPAGVVNAHLWEFPNVEILNGKFNPRFMAKSILGVTAPNIKPFCTVKHSITRYRITLEAFHANLGGNGSAKSKILRTRGACPSGTETWLTPGQMRRLAFSAAHKKLASFAASRILSG